MLATQATQKLPTFSPQALKSIITAPKPHLEAEVASYSPSSALPSTSSTTTATTISSPPSPSLSPFSSDSLLPSMPETLDNLEWFMLATVDELLAEPEGRPWFMTATVDQVLQPPVDKLLGGRENEIDMFTGEIRREPVFTMKGGDMTVGDKTNDQDTK